MEIRNNAEALKTLLGVRSSEAAKGVRLKDSESSKPQTAFTGDEATLSGIGAAMQSSAGQDGVRLDKVAAIQQALASGSYKVEPSKVADKVVDAMLGANLRGEGE
ncbi:flagellar biosynthesis anti-sigma factor FlgM [Occallatibacter savannae]|uniref:flagellar biosynthesis anti-sigma factor FlgM n=1 Tax=Occallatibacter savannae TaxID=1002691 RepID=UPI000D69DCA8|nr:flagellar biosynthesis anti-sigma factor FlgM [Occallatibacter savannae]